jgi:hypothetical protein
VIVFEKKGKSEIDFSGVAIHRKESLKLRAPLADIESYLSH